MERYIYSAVVVSVYDGDTLTVDIDLGFGVRLHKQKVRLYGINTPELRSKDPEEVKIAIEARNFLASVVGNHTVILKTFRDAQEKYGRWLAQVFVDDATGKLVCINDEMISRKLAVAALFNRRPLG